MNWDQIQEEWLLFYSRAQREACARNGTEFLLARPRQAMPEQITPAYREELRELLDKIDAPL